MKNRLLCVALAALMAISMIACGKKTNTETSFAITSENVNEYIVKLANCEGRTVEVEKQTLTDSLVEYYADYYYKEMAKNVKGMKDGNGDVIPMTDEAIAMLKSDVFSTVSEFMVFVRATVTDYIEYDYNNMIVQQAVAEIIAESEFGEIPIELINQEKTYIEAQFSSVAEEYGTTLETYFALCGTSEDTLADEYAKQEIVFMKIAKEQGFVETEESSISNQVFDYLLSVTNVK